MIGVPDGIRTRVTAVKGRCPRPLDDGDMSRATFADWLGVSACHCQSTNPRQPVSTNGAEFPFARELSGAVYFLKQATVRRNPMRQALGGRNQRPGPSVEARPGVCSASW